MVQPTALATGTAAIGAAGAAATGVQATVEATLLNLSRMHVEAIARLHALVDGLPLREGWQRLAGTADASVRRAVQQGLALGESPAASCDASCPRPARSPRRSGAVRGRRRRRSCARR